MMEQFDKKRLYHNFYLEEWGINKIGDATQFCMSPCDLCDLTYECDKLADDLNNIEYCMCLSKGVIEDTQYKVKHPNAYFKNINDKIE